MSLLNIFHHGVALMRGMNMLQEKLTVKRCHRAFATTWQSREEQRNNWSPAPSGGSVAPLWWPPDKSLPFKCIPGARLSFWPLEPLHNIGKYHQNRNITTTDRHVARMYRWQICWKYKPVFTLNTKYEQISGRDQRGVYSNGEGRGINDRMSVGRWLSCHYLSKIGSGRVEINFYLLNPNNNRFRCATPARIFDWDNIGERMWQIKNLNYESVERIGFGCKEKGSAKQNGVVPGRLKEVPVQFYFVCDGEILRDGAIESAFLSFYKVDKILGILSK